MQPPPPTKGDFEIVFSQEQETVETLGDLMGRYCATSGPQHSSCFFSVLGLVKRLNTRFHILHSKKWNLIKRDFDDCHLILRSGTLQPRL